MNLCFKRMEFCGETAEGSVLGATEIMEKLSLPHRFKKTGDGIVDASPVGLAKILLAVAQAARDKCEEKLNSRIIFLNADGEDGKVVADAENGKTMQPVMLIDNLNLPKLNLIFGKSNGLNIYVLNSEFVTLFHKFSTFERNPTSM